MSNFLLLNYHLLLQNLHGIDSLRILLSNLIDLSKGSFTDKFQDLEVFWTIVLLVGPLKGNFNVYFACGHGFCVFSSLEWEPTFDRGVFGELRFKIDISKEVLCSRTSVIDRQIEMIVLTNDIAG